MISASILNTHVRDNFNETVPAKTTAAGQTVMSTGAGAIAMVPARAYKSANEIVNNSTTLQNDNHLLWTVAANEVWAFRGFLVFTIASGAPGFKLAWTLPGGTSTWRWSGLAHEAATGTVQTNAQALHTAPDGVLAWPGLSAATVTCEFQGFMVLSATGNGTAQLTWAQNSAVASDLTLLLGSYIDLTRLA